MTSILIGLLLFGGLLLLVGGMVGGEPAVSAAGLAGTAAAAAVEYSSGRLTLLGLILLTVGVVALLSELVLPGGVAGAGGVVLLMVALYAGWDTPPLMAIPALLTLAVGGYLMWRGGMTEGLARVPDLTPGTGRDERPIRTGEEGVAVTALRPGGTARFGGEDREVRLRAGTAEPGEQIVVVGNVDMLLLVDLFREPEPPAAP